VLTDHASDLLLCSSKAPAEHLRAERVAGRIEVVGDVMVDVAQLVRVEPRAGEYVAVTAHRAGTVDDPERLRRLVELLLAVPLEVVFPLHPRTRERLTAFGLLDRLAAGVTLLPPLGYVEFTALVRGAQAVLTDSGGVQKEAYLAGVKCITLRDTTEWTETVDAGWNTLVDLDADAALAALERTPPPARPALYGDGRAGERVVAALVGLRA
jgi:UDP-N-acetylglucosamine 2-epimerase (non-hydrolysing)/UDP-GlcNAc3NAcA epimerase